MGTVSDENITPLSGTALWPASLLRGMWAQQLGSVCCSHFLPGSNLDVINKPLIVLLTGETSQNVGGSPGRNLPIKKKGFKLQALPLYILIWYHVPQTWRQRKIIIAKVSYQATYRCTQFNNGAAVKVEACASGFENSSHVWLIVLFGLSSNERATIVHLDQIFIFGRCATAPGRAFSPPLLVFSSNVPNSL